MTAQFPYNDQQQALSQQAILAGVADVSAGIGVFRVSAITAAASLSFNGDASNNRVSAFSNDAGLLRVSSIGSTSSPLSADSSSISAKQGDASLLRVSAILDSGSVSAKQGDAGLLRVSAILDNGSVSAKSGDANQLHVCAVQGDAGLLRTSVVGTLTVSAHEVKQSDAASLRISAILAAGVSSVGAASFAVSAAQNDAGALRASALNQDANFMHASAVQGDAALLRASSFASVATVNTGGASIYFTSSGATSQVSTVKSSNGRLYGYHLGNPAGVDQYLQVFNASGGATAGTDTPALTLYVPTLGGAVMSLGAGIAFSNGIQVIGTSTANGQTIGASAMRINLFYA